MSRFEHQRQLQDRPEKGIPAHVGGEQGRFVSRVPAKPMMPAHLQAFKDELEAMHGLDMESKLAKRRELVAKWRPQIQQWIGAGCKGKFPPFAWCLQWLFDLGDLEGYFQWLEVALQYGIAPEHSGKHGSFATCMVHDVLAWAEENHKNGASSDPWLSKMIELAETHDWGGVGAKRKTQAHYLQFHDLDRRGLAEEAIRFGVTAYAQYGASIKMRLEELIDLQADSETAIAAKRTLAELKGNWIQEKFSKLMGSFFKQSGSPGQDQGRTTEGDE